MYSKQNIDLLAIANGSRRLKNPMQLRCSFWYHEHGALVSTVGIWNVWLVIYLIRIQIDPSALVKLWSRMVFPRSRWPGRSYSYIVLRRWLVEADFWYVQSIYNFKRRDLIASCLKRWEPLRDADGMLRQSPAGITVSAQWLWWALLLVLYYYDQFGRHASQA